MSTNHNTKRVIALLFIILLTSCTETIIKELPANVADESVNSNDEVGVLAETTQTFYSTQQQNTADRLDLAFADPTPASRNQTELEVASIPVSSESPLISLSDTSDNSIVGTPGATADCRNSVPCRWISDDEIFAVTITSADNIASRGRLVINYRIDTLHDSAVILGNSPNFIDSNGLSHTVTEQSLGAGNGINPLNVVAGAPTRGSLAYSAGITDQSVDSVGVTVIDNGYIRNAIFNNLPVGPLQSPTADCQFVLPCSWISSDSQSKITLVSAGGFSTVGNLVVGFTVEVTADSRIALDMGTSAKGDDGTQFVGRTHSLANEQGFDKLSKQLDMDRPVPATIFFSRTTTQPDSLSDLALVVYEDKPVPRWNPVFENVPLN